MGAMTMRLGKERDLRLNGLKSTSVLDMDVSLKIDSGCQNGSMKGRVLTSILRRT